MNAYQENRAWADQYEPQLKQIVGSLLPQTASFKLDTKQATDLVIYQIKHGPRAGQPVGAIAARLRRPGNFWQRSFNSVVWWGIQFTIRYHLDSTTETEYQKIMNGFGDWFLYGHVEQDIVRHWMVLDLEVFRYCEKKRLALYESQDNRDGSYFRAYDVRMFPPKIFIGASNTIRDALIHGVPAVEPLPIAEINRQLRPAPDLHELIKQYGGYNRIPQDAWLNHDIACTEYRALMRAGLLELKP